MAAKAKRERARPNVDEAHEPFAGTLDDDTEIADAVVRDLDVDDDLERVEVQRCRIDGSRFVGIRIAEGRFTDCVVRSCDLSGVVFDRCELLRVEFHDCRMSSLQCPQTSFDDVAFFGCKLDDANFRLTKWTRAEWHDCELVDADFYGAALPGAVIRNSNLRGANVDKATMTGARLHGSNLDDLRGGNGLRGVRLAIDQVVPVTYAVLAALDIVVDLDPDDVDHEVG